MKFDYFIGENIKKDYFRSTLVETLRQSGKGLVSPNGKIMVFLPPKLGFCHGVVRAIRMAMYATEKYRGRKIYLLNEMIHNSIVNQELLRVGVNFFDGVYSNSGLSLNSITKDDVVIIPSFGGSTFIYEELKRLDCIVIDATCGEILSVWKRIQKYNAVGFTSLIFGNYAHEEVVATASRAKCYLILKDLAVTQMVADYIRTPNPTEAKHMLVHFKNACSPGFNPEVHLKRVGMASQTTMYASDFIKASWMIRQAVLDRYEEEKLEDHFLELYTVCSATQERQNAVQFLLPYVDMMIIVGGYNSNNTMNLARIASEKVPTYHVDGTGKILLGGILYQPVGSKQETLKVNWLPQKEYINIGMTSGASTPDSVLEQVIGEVLVLDGGIAEQER